MWRLWRLFWAAYRASRARARQKQCQPRLTIIQLRMTEREAEAFAALNDAIRRYGLTKDDFRGPMAGRES